MKKYLPILAVLAVAFFGFRAQKVHAAGYQYYVSITVTSTNSIASGTNSNFPMLVSSTLSSWEPVSDGGHIQNLTIAPNGGQEPADLVFATSTANCGVANLNFETETYTSSTGALVDWVDIPTMQAGAAIYACYDNSSVTADQSHPSSTWSSNFSSVWHLNEPSFTTRKDSVGNNNLTDVHSNIAAANGFIGSNSASFASALFPQLLTPANALGGSSSTPWTISFWANCATDQGQFIWSDAGDGTFGSTIELGVNEGSSFIYLFDDAQNESYSGPVDIAAGTWENYVFQFPGYGTASYNYYNGAQSQIAFGNSYPGGFKFDQIGRQANGASPLDCNLDEMEYSSSTLSPQWILTEYNNQNSPSNFYTVGAETGLLPPTILNFSASSSAVLSAGTSTLSFNVANASSVAITPGTFSTSTLVGSMTVNPTSTTMYTLNATNANGTVSATTTVTVENLNISGVGSSGITSNGATITWTTSIPADSTVSYGTSMAYGATSTDPTLVTSHSITLSGLAAGTGYHFAVMSSALGTSTASGDNTFTTSVAPSSGGGASIHVGVASAYAVPYVPVVGSVAASSSTPSSLTAGTSGASAADLQSQINTLTAELDALLAQAGSEGHAFMFTRDLSLWDTGSDVGMLQRFLIDRNVGPAARALAFRGVTNVFGLFTYNALVEFQISVGISPASGYFGPITRAWVNGGGE